MGENKRLREYVKNMSDNALHLVFMAAAESGSKTNGYGAKEAGEALNRAYQTNTWRGWTKNPFSR